MKTLWSKRNVKKLVYTLETKQVSGYLIIGHFCCALASTCVWFLAGVGLALGVKALRAASGLWSMLEQDVSRHQTGLSLTHTYTHTHTHTQECSTDYFW